MFGINSRSCEFWAGIKNEHQTLGAFCASRRGGEERGVCEELVGATMSLVQSMLCGFAHVGLRGLTNH